MKPSSAIFSVVLLLSIQILAAQQDEEFDKLMTRKRISCYDVEENGRFLIPKYYQEEKFDSIRYLLRYWQRNCGEVETITRMNLILDAGVNTIDQYPFSKRTIWNFLNYKRKMEFARKNPERKDYYTGNLFWTNQEKINDQFDVFTSVFASEALTKNGSALARNILGFYSGNMDSLFTSLYNKAVGNEALQSSYDSIITDIKAEFVTYMSATIGYWVPTGNASVLGNHPELGFNMGAMRYGWSADLMLLFKFVHTPSSYIVRKNGIPTSTKYFFGGYIAGQAGYDVVRQKSYDISILTGIAYDGFDAIASSGSNTNDNVSVGSLNLNLGLGGRFYTEEFRGTFITAEVRYNFVDYRNPGGTDLSGNTWSFRVAYNFSTAWQNELLHELGAF